MQPNEIAPLGITEKVGMAAYPRENISRVS